MKSNKSKTPSHSTSVKTYKHLQINFATARRDFRTLNNRLVKLVAFIKKHPDTIFTLQECRKLINKDFQETFDPVAILKSEFGGNYRIFDVPQNHGDYPMKLITMIPKQYNIRGSYVSYMNKLPEKFKGNDRQKRAILSIVIQHSRGTLLLVNNTFMNMDRETRHIHCKELKSIIRNIKRMWPLKYIAVITAGDFNFAVFEENSLKNSSIKYVQKLKTYTNVLDSHSGNSIGVNHGFIVKHPRMMPNMLPGTFLGLKEDEYAVSNIKTYQDATSLQDVFYNKRVIIHDTHIIIPTEAEVTESLSDVRPKLWTDHIPIYTLFSIKKIPNNN